MKLYDTPSAVPVFRYRNSPLSGNITNGVGETTFRPPSKVFHQVPVGDPRKEPKNWVVLDRHFNLTMGVDGPWWGMAQLRQVLMNRWQMRRSNGPVAEKRIDLGGPQDAAAHIRDWVLRRYPMALVGFTKVGDDAVFENETVPHRQAIAIGYPMNREEMLHVPHKRASVEVMAVYRKVGKVALELSEYLRDCGWAAKSYFDTKSTELLHIPLAVQAGLGELGKHGSVISKEYGSNFRLSSVLTELPLADSQPVELGVDDMCVSCRICTTKCPPDAIFDTKQMVRGVEKWYVDFDKCVPYFAETAGCAICLEVCPWSEPGAGEKMVKVTGKIRSRRQSKKEAAA